MEDYPRLVMTKIELYGGAFNYAWEQSEAGEYTHTYTQTQAYTWV